MTRLNSMKVLALWEEMGLDNRIQGFKITAHFIERFLTRYYDATGERIEPIIEDHVFGAEYVHTYLTCLIGDLSWAPDGKLFLEPWTIVVQGGNLVTLFPI